MAILDEIENKIKERGVQKLTENNKNKFWVDRTNSMKGDSSIYNCPKCNSKGFYAYLDEYGRVVDTELSDRILGASILDIQKSKVIALACGDEKVDAIKAVLKSRLIDVLVTSIDTAQKLL